IKTDKRPAITSDFIGVLPVRSLSHAAAASAPTRRRQRRARLDKLPFLPAARPPPLPHPLRLQNPTAPHPQALELFSRASPRGRALTSARPVRNAIAFAYTTKG